MLKFVAEGKNRVIAQQGATTAINKRQTLRPRPGVRPESPKVTPKKRRPVNEKVSLSSNIILPENNYCEPLEDEGVMEEDVVKKEVVNEKVSKEEPPSSEETIEYVKLKKPKLELKSIVDSGHFRCEVCNGLFSTGQGLVKHKQLHEQEWSDEDETLPSVSDFMVKSEFFEKANAVEEPSFQCNMCSRSFPTTHTLKRHKLLHVRDARKCTLCGTMFCKRHNHIVAQPQISTETNFEDDETNNMNETAESLTLTSSDGDDLDEGLELLLNSDSPTLESIVATQEQLESPADLLHKDAPAITYNPRKPGLLTAFKSFLTKHKPSDVKPKKYIIGRCQSMMATQTTATCTNAITTTTTPIITLTAPITAITPPVTSITPPVNAPISTATLPKTTASTAIIMTSTTGMISKPVSKLFSKTDGLTTSTKTITPQPGKPVIIVPRQQQLHEPFQKMEQSTVCLSFSKPLPTNVIQEFMTYISKNESMKSTTPRLVTFTTKQDQVIAKQETKEVTSIIKLEPSITPITTTPLPEKSVSLPKQEKTTYMITTQPKSDLKTTPQIMKSPIQKPSIQKTLLPKKTSAVPSVKPKIKLNKIKPKPTVQALYQRPYVHGSQPPSPEPIFAKIKSGPWDSPFPNYPKDFVQPHLPQTPLLPPTLQMFSPQLLTSAMLEVERNFECILSN
ncbi:uncharacterized protein LOC110164477 isoform X2 [Boleophthalmus pectinirostris]|uniref:uncharacterized protein LOC110164477 isoform X2 n=1 Tax=Boleophthalmus pectinirostris TaxID=150288 RepID=UPI002432EDF7|nr:uncharacterized protein LOC110164477 isoform X2 [Boleophthalmus pectinirostris]